MGHIHAGLKTTAANYWVNVTNTGPVDSDDVVLGFVVPPGAGQNGVPLQQLFGFEVRARGRARGVFAQWVTGCVCVVPAASCLRDTLTSGSERSRRPCHKCLVLTDSTFECYCAPTSANVL